MALTDKTIASTYKDLLTLNNSNNGVAAAGTKIQDGNGTNTALTLGSRNSKFQPVSDHTSIFLVENAAGDDILRVDTTNKLVKVNETQLVANTQYLRFFGHDINVAAGYHQLVALGGHAPNTEKTLNNGTNPVVPSFSNDADDFIHYLHYVDTNITVDAVNILVSATGATGDAINFHLVSLATGDTTTVDEFSSITVVADDTGISNAGYEQFYKVALNIQSANVDAGDYLALTIESDGTNSDYSVNAQVRYHLR